MVANNRQQHHINNSLRLAKRNQELKLLLEESENRAATYAGLAVMGWVIVVALAVVVMI